MRRYERSQKMLQRARETIPLGSQTFSKSITQFPLGVSPYFIERGEGSRVWDVDGNEYIDFINALAAITLGYGDPDVTQAVERQLKKGTIFSLSNRLEMEVAELIVEMVPCAEMVRFGKNGSDATAGAIRLARAYTGREHVAVCGYHGWQDWFIGATTRNKGVPSRVCELVHPFTYNDIASLASILDRYPGQVAAVIMEPMSFEYPKEGFLQAVKRLAHKHGAVLIFDEMITGFRFARGGAQELFGVIPDLACFGKGMANGYPISAVVGRREIMSLMEEVFFSFTFGGELLSLAAAKAVLGKLMDRPILSEIAQCGQMLIDELRRLIGTIGAGDWVAVQGHPTWSLLQIKDYAGFSQWEIKSLLLQEVFARGILTIGTHNMSYAHSEEDVGKLIAAYGEVFAQIQEGCKKGNLLEMLRCQPIRPLFKVR